MRFLNYGRKEHVDDRVWEPMIVAERRYLEATFDELDARHGGIRPYAGDVIGLSDVTLAAIERELLEPTRVQ